MDCALIRSSVGDGQKLRKQKIALIGRIYLKNGNTFFFGRTLFPFLIKSC